ncbi:MAG: prolyl oligopeptidase family serine peptidase [Candidatus Latescibacteria bacterium]|nr:prolyl oligopeptidase family serine peptidase [Candidatus Latescibacterota bacterium]NIO57237.1 prolyl oligopeptidase family serine peptidase [Candidatus Latescibacterota bacterium]
MIVLVAFAVVSCQQPASREIPQYTIEQFMDVKAIFGSTFSPDEKHIAFTSDESGIFNAYLVPVQGGETKQITHSDSNSVIALSFFPHDNRLLVMSDQGGNEIWHLYLREEDGTVRDLTAWEGARSTFEAWSYDDKSFFFSCNKRDSKFMDIYEMDIETYEPTMVYQNDAGYFLGDVSNDKRFMAFGKTITTHATEMYLYDRKTEELKHLTPEEEEVSYSPVAFSNDSKSLYYLTDKGREFKCLNRYDIESGEIETVYEADWDLMEAYFSRNEKYRVVGINENARTVIKVADTKTGKQVNLPKLPEADVTSVNISRSEKLMTFYVNSSRSPNNLYVYDFETKQYRKLTDSMNPKIVLEDLVDAQLVSYESYDGVRIPAILYKPHRAESGVRVPALVWVHGGPGGQSRIGYRATIQYLVNHGYLILAVNNRGSSGYGKTFYKMDDKKHGEADLGDCVEAKKFLTGTGYVDPGKIGIIGGSYGGYMVLAAMAFEPEQFAVGVDLFGISNWVRTLKSIPPWWEAFKKALYEELGDPATDEERLHRISPLFHADNIRRPLMVLQGANDPRVLKQESDEIVEAVKKNNVPVEYVLFDDEGHGFRKKENRIKGYKAVLDFLDEHLKGEGE